MKWLALIALCLSGCAVTGQYVWVDDYKPPHAVGGRGADAPYRLGPGDVVSVKVLGHDELSTARAQVRADGRISVPLEPDLEVDGLSLEALSTLLRQKLRPYLVNPAVSLSLEKARPLTVSVVGEVKHPGSFSLDPGSGVLVALADAGGFTPYAHENRIFVLRRARSGARPVRIRFDYERLVHAQGASATFRLKRDDIVVVE